MLGEEGLLNTHFTRWNRGKVGIKTGKRKIKRNENRHFGCEGFLLLDANCFWFHTKACMRAAPPAQIKTCLNFRKARETPTIATNKQLDSRL